MKIHTFTDNGGSIARGTVEVGGYHLSLADLDATVNAVTLKGGAVNKHSMFSVTTSGATDIVVLAADITVGAQFIVNPSLGCVLDVESGGSVNGGADTASATITSGSYATVLCIAANTFICEATTAAGVESAPVPA